MKAKDKFEETKIKMVMKLKKLSRSAAVEEIARMHVARRAGAEKNHKGDERRSSGVDPARALEPNGGEEFMSAKEFFGETNHDYSQYTHSDGGRKDRGRGARV